MYLLQFQDHSFELPSKESSCHEWCDRLLTVSSDSRKWYRYDVVWPRGKKGYDDYNEI